MQSLNFVLGCTNLDHMNKNFYHMDTSFIWKSIQSFATFGYSLLQNNVKPIKIKQKLLFFQAGYISWVFWLFWLESIIVLHTDSDWKSYVYMVMKQQLKWHHRWKDAHNREPCDRVFFPDHMWRIKLLQSQISNCSFTTLMILIVSFLVFFVYFLNAIKDGLKNMMLWPLLVDHLHY